MRHVTYEYIPANITWPFWLYTLLLAMGWLRLVGSIESSVSFANEPYKRDDVLQKSLMNTSRHTFLGPFGYIEFFWLYRVLLAIQSSFGHIEFFWLYRVLLAIQSSFGYIEFFWLYRVLLAI